MKMLLTILLAVLIFSGVAGGVYPSYDITGDYIVDMEDLDAMVSGWLTSYNLDDLAGLSNEWLKNYAFITTWDTSLGDGTTVTLALGGIVNATIDWGDGVVEFVIAPGPHEHDYGTDGIYTVSVTGSVMAYNSFSNGGDNPELDDWFEVAKLISVDSWGQLGFTSMYHAFSHCSNLISVPDTSDGLETVSNMQYMFYRASSFNSDICSWNTSSVTDMRYMFRYSLAFNQDISNWNTSNVIDMHCMFNGASAFNQNIGNWNTSNVTNMNGMFNASSFNNDIGNWNTSSVTDMRYMFSTASAFNQNISNWNTSNVTNMDGMFSGASSFNQDLSGWCVTQIPSESSYFDQNASSWVLPRPVWGNCP